MVLLETAADAVSAAEILSSKLPKGLSSAAVRLYTALVATAVETARGKGYSPTVTHMVMHAPLEQVAKACKLSRVTAWRHLPALKALGLVDYRTHKGNLRGRVRNTGTVWMIRLNPASGRACRLSYQDLKHQWRDLQRDVRAGRTSYAALKHTKAPTAGLVDIQRILNWTLPNTALAPVKVCMIQPRKLDLSAVLDVRFAGRQSRSAAVDTGAQALCQALGDARSVNFYRMILHAAYRASQQGTDYFQMLYQMAVRVQRSDIAEGFARRGGALFVSRLKQAGLLEDLLRSS